MFKILLRHIIIEQCTQVFFDQAFDNFIKPIIKPFLITAGYSVESTNDIIQFHGIDIMRQIQIEIQRELDSELLKGLARSAKNIYKE